MPRLGRDRCLQLVEPSRAGVPVDDFAADLVRPDPLRRPGQRPMFSGITMTDGPEVARSHDSTKEIDADLIAHDPG